MKANVDDYLTLLREANTEVIGDWNGTKSHTTVKCMICGHVREATPVSITQAFKKRGKNGCPVCAQQNKNERLSSARLEVFQKFKQLGLEILSPEYNGEQTTTTKIHVRNINCGHDFWAAPGNILHRGVTCNVCGKQDRIEQLQAFNEEHRPSEADLAKFYDYKSLVHRLTDIEYNKHKQQLNPNNLLIGLCGVPGAYQKDHIVPVRVCFDMNVPPEEAARYENIQLLTWEENAAYKYQLKENTPIPPHLSKYFPT